MADKCTINFILTTLILTLILTLKRLLHTQSLFEMTLYQKKK